MLKERGIDLPPAPAIPKREDSNPCLLSIVQEQIWRAWRSEPGLYNEVVALRLKGSLNVIALIQALKEVVRRHDILRARFVEVNGQVHQYTSAEFNLEVPLADLSYISAAEREAELKLLAEDQVGRAFGLDQLALIRGSIVVLSPSEHMLVMTLPQIVWDGWSRNILINELSHFYKSYTEGEESEIGELKRQYRDFAMWQRARLEAGEMDRDIEYWRGKLAAGLSPVFAHDSAKPTVKSRKRGSYKLKLSRVGSEGVKRIGKNQNLTPYMVLLAVWQVLLGRYRGQMEVAVSTVAANRNRAELLVLIGPVSNTLLIKLDLNGNPSFRQVLRKVCQEVKESIEHQELPLEWLLSEMRKSENDGQNRVADVMFVMEEEIGEEILFGGIKAFIEEVAGTLTDSDLTILMRRRGEEFEGRIEYLTSLFDEETIRHMAAAYGKLIEVVAQDVDCNIGDLPPFIDLGDDHSRNVPNHY